MDTIEARIFIHFKENLKQTNSMHYADGCRKLTKTSEKFKIKVFEMERNAKIFNSIHSKNNYEENKEILLEYLLVSQLYA